MNTLNNLYNLSCKPAYNSYEKLSNNIILIDNFFEDFNKARNFFINRDKWECISYQENSKPGYESFFPKWVGKSLLENFIFNNQIETDVSSYETECNFLTHSFKLPLWSITSSCYIPHIDSIPKNNIHQYICLINLNNTPISTNFYSYKNFNSCNDEFLLDDFFTYISNLKNEMTNFYFNKKTLDRKDIAVFLNKKKECKFNLTKKISYKPNQAIIYPGNLFHSPNITKNFSEKNPRAVLRVSFYKKVEKFDKKSKGVIYN